MAESEHLSISFALFSKFLEQKDELTGLMIPLYNTTSFNFNIEIESTNDQIEKFSYSDHET